MMELVKNKNCCGCSACYAICPKKAIEMVEDEYGYTYPRINLGKCVKCGLCKKTCAYQNENKFLNEPIKTYASASKNNDLIKKSASGGIFASIAKRFLEDGGTVYGVTMNKQDKEFKVKHIRIDKKEELSSLQGSKYVQSDMSNVYSLIKNDLRTRRKVLFCGTPCQVNGLKGFLQWEEYNNLYTIDIICHGVPNNKMFNDYLKVLEAKEKGEIIDFKFRDKTKKWGLNAYVEIQKKERIVKKPMPSYTSSYYQLFLDALIYRENCYNCPYAGKLRTGDITIGDYWKIEKEHPEYLNDLDIKKGVSCILVNTKKGEELITDFSNEIVLLNSKFDKVQKHNAQLMHPSIMKKKRDKILKLYISKGYNSVDRYYNRSNFCKNFIKKILQKVNLK